MARRQPNRVISLSCFICNYPLTNETFKYICAIFFSFYFKKLTLRHIAEQVLSLRHVAEQVL
jgi:hypothetical protein